MLRRIARHQPTRELELTTTIRRCPGCDGPLWAAYKSRRTLITLEGVARPAVQVRRCRDRNCPRFAMPIRPESGAGLALPKSEFGPDVIVLVSTLRHAQNRSIPEIHAELLRRGVPICMRSIANLLDRYDELLALSLSDPARLRRVTAKAGRVILALDGLQPDVGHEVLWVLRDVISGEIILAESLLSSCRADLAELIVEVEQALQVDGGLTRRSPG